MAEVFTTGTWRPKEGHEEAFVEAWTELAHWGSGFDGVETIRLARDLRDEGRFVSFAQWDSSEHVHAWEGADEFQRRLDVVREHVTESQLTVLDVVVAVAGAKAAVG